MNNTILSWDGTDQHAIYQWQLKENPLYYNTHLKIWVAYSYAHCKAILEHADAHIPKLAVNEALNEKAKLLIDKMARLSNGEQHFASRAAAMAVFEKIKQVAAGEILKELLNKVSTEAGFDWVETVGKQLPARLISAGLAFDEADSNYIAENLQTLVRIMLPNNTGQDIERLNPVVETVYNLAEKYAGRAGLLNGEKDWDEAIICNLVSLFIQCYDAGRGLLCNALQNMAKYADHKSTDWRLLINENLRYDPPVHNTRRIAARDIVIDGQTIKAGEIIMVVLAAANLDDAVFADPNRFDLTRENSDRHLTFGTGGHNCLAKYFCIDIAVEACRFLAENYRQIDILQKEFTYEPQLNVRLVKELRIRFS
jgi:cytochrome P450